jgi:hypothetical protein
MQGFISLAYAHATLLQGTSALNCKSGVIGGSAGVAQDTLFLGFYIDLTAVAGTTLTVTGMADSSGAQQPMVLNGQITTDTPFIFAYPILNELAPFTFQPSTAAKVWVFTAAYTALGTRGNT